MKKLIFIGMLVLFCVAIHLFSGKESQVVQVQTEQEEEVIEFNIEPEEMARISKVRDDFNERTKVSYIDNTKKGSFCMSASYDIEENDILKKRLPKPQAKDFMICVISSHKGAREVSRVELTINNSTFILRPNYTKHEGYGRFTMLFDFGRMLDNADYPKQIAFAEHAEARVIFDNGSDTYELSKEDLKPVSVIYRSYINDGGNFE